MRSSGSRVSIALMLAIASAVPITRSRATSQIVKYFFDLGHRQVDA